MNSYITFIVKKVLLSIVTVFAISIFAFLIMQMTPGDPVRAMLGAEADEAIVEATRTELNLDKPLVVQYTLWLKHALRGDFGTSLVLNQDIGEILATRIPVTLSLTIPALIISLILGILIGVLCAVHRGSALDQIMTVLMTTMNGIPVFWIGIMMMYFFGVKLGWLPLMGYTSPFEDFGQYVAKAVMPVTIMAFGPLSSIARQVRTNMLEVINQDYIRTARANGLSENSVKYKHALKNSLIPVITLIALQVRSLVGGSLLGEQVFSIAGMGRLIMVSVMNKDYLVVQATVFVISLFVVACNLILDISYGLVDPKIRLTGGKGR
ncbi:ABC transporter permease [Hungatella hathewayi]|uniref:ABC transporter permease n=1 Tax=Hungatella hathewayi TaxID=154046 RepID=UPI000E506029|nr:ABC transporter permease [Hungatella hathewayi]RHB76022.1 ABC transporter permease [Hungatella hathewayi]